MVSGSGAAHPPAGSRRLRWAWEKNSQRPRWCREACGTVQRHTCVTPASSVEGRDRFFLRTGQARTVRACTGGLPVEREVWRAGQGIDLKTMVTSVWTCWG